MKNVCCDTVEQNAARSQLLFFYRVIIILSVYDEMKDEIKVTTLSGVNYASVYEQTHSKQCCNLFIS